MVASVVYLRAAWKGKGSPRQNRAPPFLRSVRRRWVFGVVRPAESFTHHLTEPYPVHRDDMHIRITVGHVVGDPVTHRCRQLGCGHSTERHEDQLLLVPVAVVASVQLLHHRKQPRRGRIIRHDSVVPPRGDDQRLRSRGGNGVALFAVETKTLDLYAPSDGQISHPAFVAELKGKDPGFVAVRSIQMIGDGHRRVIDGWVYSKVTYVREEPFRSTRAQRHSTFTRSSLMPFAPVCGLMTW